MMYDEFCTLIGGEKVTYEEYKDIIEPVYMWHPMFETGMASDKQKCAKLYELGGLGIFKDLAPAAKAGEERYDAMTKALTEYNEAKRRYEAIADEKHKLEEMYVSNTGK